MCLQNGTHTELITSCQSWAHNYPGALGYAVLVDGLGVCRWGWNCSHPFSYVLPPNPRCKDSTFKWYAGGICNACTGTYFLVLIVTRLEICLLFWGVFKIFMFKFNYAAYPFQSKPVWEILNMKPSYTGFLRLCALKVKYCQGFWVLLPPSTASPPFPITYLVVLERENLIFQFHGIECRIFYPYFWEQELLFQVVEASKGMLLGPV